MKEKIETKKDEVRYTTSDPKRILNRFLVKDVFRKWTENFFDKDTGEVCSIERSELLFERGSYLDKETISRIMFYMQEGSITEVEVSNQKRMGIETVNYSMFPYMVQCICIEKKRKYMLMAQNIRNVMEIMNDYLELKTNGAFRLVQIKECEYTRFITDRFSTVPLDETAKLAAEFPDLYSEEERKVIFGIDNDKEADVKFYDIKAKIVEKDSSGEKCFESISSFLVKTYTADRAIMLIRKWIDNEREKRIREDKENGREIERNELYASIEESSIIPVFDFVPEDFSLAYQEVPDDNQ